MYGCGDFEGICIRFIFSCRYHDAKDTVLIIVHSYIGIQDMSCTAAPSGYAGTNPNIWSEAWAALEVLMMTWLLRVAVSLLRCTHPAWNMKGLLLPLNHGRLLGAGVVWWGELQQLRGLLLCEA